MRLGDRVGALAYRSDEQRDLRLDFVRGLAVVAMVVDHLAGPSALYLITGGNRFFTSAAETFVLVSGLVAGQVYGRIAQRQSLHVALRRLLQRTWSLYLLTVALTMISISLGLPGSSAGAQSGERSPPQLLWSILTLHQTAYLVDVMLLYTLLLLVAPVAVLLMYESRTWVVLLGSWLLWGGYQVFPGQSEIPWPIADNNLFHFAAWQVLFFTGLVLGYHRKRIGAALQPSMQWPLMCAAAIGFGALVLLFVTIQSGGSTPAEGKSTIALALQERVFAKSDLQIGRLAASLIVFGFLFLSITRFWVPLRTALGWLLLPLGQNALYAYTAHFSLALAVPVVGGQGHFPFAEPSNTLIQVVGVALIWLAVRFRVFFPTTSTRRWWMLAPAPIAVATVLILSREPVARGPQQLATQAAVSDATRLARVFGTPVTRQMVGESLGPQSLDSDVPIPAPVSTPGVRVLASGPMRVDLAADTARATPFVSAIRATIDGDFREQSFHSPALDRDMSYYAYLPAGYKADTRRYPVLYMLHGGGGSKDEWPSYGLISTVDRLIGTGDIGPLIVVLPQGDNGYWVNQANEGPRWGDYLAHDVVRQVDAAFRTVADPDHRAIGGLSMGGAGALQLAFNHPNLFHVVGAHSPSLHVDDGTFPILGSGPDFAWREPLKLAAEAPGVETLDIWIDAGDQDPWLERDQMLHQALVDRGIVHHWSIVNGGHEGAYWQHNLETYMRSYDTALNHRDDTWDSANALD